MPNTQAPQSNLIRDLGIVGWYQQEAPMIAALATETPLLLVGPHGTGKSLLLERLAKVMDLSFRHYNASILNFDDLIGFPIPDHDRVKYLRTPVDAWDAQAIFIDEISRCRPDLQNRLFPLIHEKKLQGAALPQLQYRWSAMNPPPDENASEDECYIGAQPLDPALADRFGWIIAIPTELQLDDRFDLIRGPEIKPNAGVNLQKAIQQTRSRMQISKQIFGENVLRYVDAVAMALHHSNIKLSNRRLRILYDNILSLLATQRFDSPSDASFLALKYSIPQRAQRSIDEEKLIRAHRAALRVKALPVDDICRRLLQEPDPVERIAIALSSTDEDIMVATILDARASLTFPKRLALSTVLFPVLVTHKPNTPAIVFEAIGEDVSLVESLVPTVESIATHSQRYILADSVSKSCARLSDTEVWIEDILWTAFRQEQLDDPDALVSFARTCKQIITEVLG